MSPLRTRYPTSSMSRPHIRLATIASMASFTFVARVAVSSRPVPTPNMWLYATIPP